MRYRDDLPPVLKGLTLSIKGGSRVGVVGRTGAGKSSLISALFRLVEYDRDRYEEGVFANALFLLILRGSGWGGVRCFRAHFIRKAVQGCERWLRFVSFTRRGTFTC